MNCQKLHSDIEKLKSLRDELSAKLEESTESGLGKAALSSLSHEASSSTETLLEEYAYDLVEQNINDKESRNSEFLNSILEQYWQEQDQIDQSEVESTPESLITPDTTVDQVRNNLSEYLKSDKKLDSNLLVYTLKEKLGLINQSTEQYGSTAVLGDLEELYKDIMPESIKDKTLPRLAYLYKIAERIKNLEVLETESYIFMLPKDKWEQGKIKLPNPENNSETPEHIAPSNLTAILKSPVYYDWSYETDGRKTEDEGNAKTLVYDEKWVGKEIRHFPWTKELLKTNEEFLKSNGFHIPTIEDWIQIYDNLKAKYGDYNIAIPSTALKEDLNLAFSGYVYGGELRYVGNDDCFWSASEESAISAYCLAFGLGDVEPVNSDDRSVANSVRCVSSQV